MKKQKRYGVIGTFANKLMVRYHHKDASLAQDMVDYAISRNLDYKKIKNSNGTVDLEIMCTDYHLNDLKKCTVIKQISRLENKLAQLKLKFD